jgi:acyl carrier protein
MSNRDKYAAAFQSTLMVEEAELPNLKYQDVSTWDSVGHMALIAALEEAFGIELHIDDIIDFSSYIAGQAILAKYHIRMEDES